VVLGVRDYVIGGLPRAQRFFLFFVGARGSRERGLAYLEEAAEKGEYLRSYAQVLLLFAHIRAGELDRALARGLELRQRYPRNPLLSLEVAKLYRQLEHYEEAKRVSNELLAEVIAHPHNPRIVGVEDALLELAMIASAEGQLERALELLRDVERLGGASERVVARALLERGKLFDRVGQREKALAAYMRVLQLASDRETSRLARQYQKRPYRETDQKE